MNKLIKLEKISVPNVKALRSLYDSIESNVRVLNAVGIESAHFGPLLIPLALEKLPNVIQLQISRSWEITSGTLRIFYVILTIRHFLQKI